MAKYVQCWSDLWFSFFHIVGISLFDFKSNKFEVVSHVRKMILL